MRPTGFVLYKIEDVGFQSLTERLVGWYRGLLSAIIHILFLPSFKSERGSGRKMKWKRKWKRKWK